MGILQIGRIVTALYVLAAVLPAAFLMRYIYRQDRVERESPLLLVSLILCGVLAALASIVLGRIGGTVLDILVQE